MSLMDRLGFAWPFVRRVEAWEVRRFGRSAITTMSRVPALVLETTGRRSGQPRHTPVGNGLDPAGDVFWLFAVHGTQADYVRNILKNPRVRVKISGRWRDGTAVPLPDDDAVARSRSMRYQWDAAIGRLMATRPMTIRVDLSPVHDSRT
jgi:deazaflavin-dependent oxidoreductase (nitroreductase family)